jgi:hypothetical protein
MYSVSARGAMSPKCTLASVTALSEEVVATSETASTGANTGGAAKWDAVDLTELALDIGTTLPDVGTQQGRNASPGGMAREDEIWRYDGAG